MHIDIFNGQSWGYPRHEIVGVYLCLGIWHHWAPQKSTVKLSKCTDHWITLTLGKYLKIPRRLNVEQVKFGWVCLVQGNVHFTLRSPSSLGFSVESCQYLGPNTHHTSITNEILFVYLKIYSIYNMLVFLPSSSLSLYISKYGYNIIFHSPESCGHLGECVWKCRVPHCTQWFCWSLSRF